MAVSIFIVSLLYTIYKMATSNYILLYMALFLSHICLMFYYIWDKLDTLLLNL